MTANRSTCTLGRFKCCRSVAVRGRLTAGGYKGRYGFHCHNLEHEDMAMMANFEVV